MSFTPSDAVEGTPPGDGAPAPSGSGESPPAVAIAPLSPEEAARQNARDGRWAMNEYYDGWVWLGADGKPVMRNDGSRVGFFFHDVERLAAELAGESTKNASLTKVIPSPETAAEAGRAEAWQRHRRALAPLDSGFNKDWDPQVQTSTFATITKLIRLLAYRYAQTTEPEEAARRAISDLLGKPVDVKGARTRLWARSGYNPETVQSVADGLMRQVLGPGKSEDERANTVGSSPATDVSSEADAAQSLQLKGSDFSRSVLNVAERPQAHRNRTLKLDSETFIPPEQSAVPLSIPATDKAVPLYDSDGKPVMSVTRDGKSTQVLAPEGLNFGVFTAAGEEDKKEGDRAILQRLINFVPGGPWDLQRPVSEMKFGVPNKHKFVDDFVNVASVAIGVYAAAAGWSLDGILTWMNGFAWAFSDFGNVQFDSKYKSLPERNVLNTTLGYNLQKNGKVPKSVY